MPIQVRTCRMHLRLATFVACAIFCFVTTALAQQPAAKVQGFKWVMETLPDLGLSRYLWLQSGGIDELKDHRISPANVSAVSANGTAFAGCFQKKGGPEKEIFVWSKASGFKEIGKLNVGHVDFVSDDGSTVVWADYFSNKKGAVNGNHLIRWSKTGGAKDLGAVGLDFEVRGASADGSEILGNDITDPHPTRWTEQGGLQSFPVLDKVLSVSVDGTVITGSRTDDAHKVHIIRWSQAGGAQDLGILKTDGKTMTVFFPARASVDGTTVVGWLRIVGKKNDDDDHAFLWTQAGGVQDLGSMTGKSASIDDISADGTVVVGTIKLAGDTSVNFVSTIPELLVRSQGWMKEEQAKAAAQAQEQAKAQAAKEEENARSAAIQEDQQARYDRIVMTGRPSQLYSLAGDFEDEGRPDLAANLYQALIDKFPDDPYTAKAIDKKDAARAAAQQQQQAQASAGQQAAANAPPPQAIEACIQQCSATLNSCKANAQTQHDSAVAKGLVGLLSKNAGMVGGAGTDSQNADSAKSACNDDYNSCSAACQ